MNSVFYEADRQAAARNGRRDRFPWPAAAIGFLVLSQTPSLTEMVGVALVVGGVALRESEAAE
jgi:hypothetical protein